MSRRHAVRGLQIREEELRPVRGVRRPFGPAQARRPRGPDHGPASQGQIAPLFSASGGPSASVRGRGEYGVRATKTHTRSTFREPLHRVLSRSFNFSFFHLADFASAQTVKVFISETAIAGVVTRRPFVSVTPEGRKGCRAVFSETRTPGSEEGDCPSGVKPPWAAVCRGHFTSVHCSAFRVRAAAVRGFQSRLLLCSSVGRRPERPSLPPSLPEPGASSGACSPPSQPAPRRHVCFSCRIKRLQVESSL